MTRDPRIEGRRGRLAILSDPKVREWYEAKCLRTRVTGDEYARKLSFVLERLELEPRSIVTEARRNPDRLRARLVNYARELKKRGRLDNYIAKSLNGPKSWLQFNRVSFNGWPELSPIRGASLESERVPRPEELGRVLNRLSTRGRVVALMMAHAGVRPGVLGGYQGESGLTLGDIPELTLGKTIELEETPFQIRVPAHLSKTKMAYTTFGTQELATAILAELERRRHVGEELATSSPLVAAHDSRGVAASSRKKSRYGGKFVTTKALLEDVAGALKACTPPGVRWRPYVLRSYCSTRLMIAEGNGRISRDLREAILGHDTGVAGRYHVGKRWGEELLAEARREYANAAEFLETNAQSRVDVAAEFRRTLLAVAGLSEVEAAEHFDDSNEELLTILRKKLTGRESSAPSPANNNGNGNGHGLQKPVTLEEAEALLAQGWTYVANFGPNRVILQAPFGK